MTSPFLQKIHTTLLVVLPDHLPESAIQELRHAVEDAVPQDWLGQVVVDMRVAHFLDSAGIGLLVATRNWARLHGKSLYLYQPGPQVKKTLAMVHLAGSFTILETARDYEALLGPAPQ